MCQIYTIFTGFAFGQSVEMLKTRQPYLLIFCLLLLAINSQAQYGGRHTYSFLELTQGARVAALGGKVVALNDSDITMVHENPALILPEMNGQLALNYVNYFSDINYGSVNYVGQWKGNTFGMGLQYMHYGTFRRANEQGIVEGNFSAADYAFRLSYARPLLDSVLVAGISFKPLFSHLEQYTSLGLSVDFGVVYPRGNFTAALVVKNLGLQLTTYAGTRESLPLNIQAGFSQKLENAPIRFVVLLDHLETLDLTYKSQLADEKNTDPITGEVVRKQGIDKWADMFMRHVIVGVELTPIKNLWVNAGYNYRRRQELLVESKTSTVGFSWGFGIKIAQFRLSYGRGTYHLAGATNHFSISTNLHQFLR